MCRSQAWRSGRVIGPLAALALVIGLALAAPAQAAFPGRNGKIAFETYLNDPRGSNYEIYTINADATGLTNLTNDPSTYDEQPAWSPDGTKIVFQSIRAGGFYDLYVMNADGTGRADITNTPSVDEDRPSWSPDGTKIVFGLFPGAGIYTMNADGTGRTRLTVSPGWDTAPVWSPDGQKIAFSRQVDSPFGDFDIYAMNPDGSALTALTDDPAIDFGPDWSPDGAEIAFNSSRDGGYASIYTMNADGSAQTRLTVDPPLTTLGPVWSPDGTKFAFSTGSDGNVSSEIYTVHSDGSAPTRVTNNSVFDRAPDWQPIPAPNHPPDCTGVTATPNSLSPADRSLQSVSIGGATDPDGDAVSLTITGVTQDESLTGDGDNTGQDAFSKYFTSDPNLASLLENKRNEVYLRAESRRHGDGRVYRIAFTGSDGRGGTCSGTATVRVPSRRGSTVDSAPPSYNSFGQ